MNDVESSESDLRIGLLCQDMSVDVNEVIPRFWQMEELTNQKFLSANDKLCEKLFVNSTKRLEDGSFQVDLPTRKNGLFKVRKFL